MIPLSFSAQVFAYHRQVLGLSQVAFAKALGVSQTMIALLESGAKPANIDLFPRLAQLCGLSIDTLIFRALTTY